MHDWFMGAYPHGSHRPHGRHCVQVCFELHCSWAWWQAHVSPCELVLRPRACLYRLPPAGCAFGVQVPNLISDPACRKYPGTTIVTDSVTSNGLAAYIKERGGKHLRYRRGYKNVISKGAG